MVLCVMGTKKVWRYKTQKRDTSRIPSAVTSRRLEKYLAYQTTDIESGVAHSFNRCPHLLFGSHKKNGLNSARFPTPIKAMIDGPI